MIKKGAIDFIGLPKPNRKNLQSPQMNVVQAPQVINVTSVIICAQLTQILLNESEKWIDIDPKLKARM